LIAGIGAVVLLVGGAVATANLGSDPKPTSANKAIDVDRSAAERADRGARPSGSAVPSPSPTDVPTSPQVTASPEATKSPTKAPRSPSKTPTTKAPTTVSSSGTCEVSYYATGSTTANGESFDPNGLTAAHKTWRFGTMVRVTNLANGKSVDVRINDRGPYVSGRCIDLARGAFVKIASVSAGVINARYEVLK
jgi:rare lipoprotein A